MNNSCIRLMLANKHTLFRTGIISLLNNNPEILVVGEASSGIEIIENYFGLLPDIILADFSMPAMSGVEAIKKIKEKDRNVKAVFITSYYSEEYIYYCIKAGGYGLLHRNITIGELIYALKEIYSGRKYFGKIFCEEKFPDILQKYEKFENLNVFGGVEKVSDKEDEILFHISEGKTSQEIAALMNVSKRTVDAYRSSLMQKFELKSLPDLIKFAIRYSNQRKFVM